MKISQEPRIIEIIPVRKIKEKIVIPGDKYVANRLLIIAALSEGKSVIHNVPDNEDINQMILCLKAFGVSIKREQDTVIIQGKNQSRKKDVNINVKDSGTLFRFITAFAALSKNKTAIDGSSRIRQRPIADLLFSLKELGADIPKKKSYPLVLNGNGLDGGTTSIDGSKSSQFISALLLVSPYAKEDVTIKVNGESVSKEYIDLTISLMERHGVYVGREDYSVFHIPSNQKYKPVNYRIPTDCSSANYFFAIAAVLGKKISIGNFDFELPHGERKFIEVLERMGCKIKKGKNPITVLGTKNLKGVSVDMSRMPDAVQTLAAVSIFAEGKTIIKNISHLKYKESDRIKDTSDELRKLGIKVSCGDNSMVINPGYFHGECVNPHNDHRMAMSFAVIGTRIHGIRILNHECINKSFPDFFNTLESIGVKLIKMRCISLIGYRASGKTTISKLLSQKLSMKLISTDRIIESKVNTPINYYVQKNSWEKFRTKEKEVLNQIKPASGSVIDTGGGIIESSGNRTKLRDLGIVIYLKATVGTLRKRMRKDGDVIRPPINGISVYDEINDAFNTRKSLYEETADIIIEVDKKKPLDIVNEIIQRAL